MFFEFVILKGERVVFKEKMWLIVFDILINFFY